MSAKKKILLVGPTMDDDKGSYGGGMGGAVRNMKILLESFESEEFEIEPGFNSIRRANDISLVSFPSRLVKDTALVLGKARGTAGVHFFGQYRSAVYREYAQTRACLAYGVPYVYQIRAGIFIDWFESCRSIERAMMTRILKDARMVLCEGVPYVDYLEQKLGRHSYHFPNFVDSRELPASVPERMVKPMMQLIFAGFCYEGKGVFELVEGCRLAAARGVPLELTLAGAEAPEFSEWMDAAEPPPAGLRIQRLGRISHDEVMKACVSHDVFALLTRHQGEGHSNVMNEAMGHGQVIVCTRHGFLESVLGEDAAFYVDPCTPESTADMLVYVNEHRDEARRRAKAARQRVEERYTSQIAFSNLERHYRELAGA